jgi:hypothetical protein
MGCFLRTREDWEREPHNNPQEFPAESARLAQRDYALTVAFGWLDQNANIKGGE